MAKMDPSAADMALALWDGNVQLKTCKTSLAADTGTITSKIYDIN
jgi:hypothetical protein